MKNDIINNSKIDEEIIENDTVKTTVKINEDGSFEKTTTYNYEDPGTWKTGKYSTSNGVGFGATYFKGKRVGKSYSTNNPKIVCTFLIIFGLAFVAIGVILAIFINLIFGVCWIAFVTYAIVSEIIRVKNKNKNKNKK